MPAEDGSAMLDDIYNKRILELAADIPRLGKLEAPHARASAVSKLCGSKVTVDLAMEDSRVSDFAHDVKACALGQASSSLMARNVIGSSAQELRDLRATMRAMLKENGPPPQGKWEELKVLRTSCATSRPATPRRCSPSMPWSNAIDQIEAAQAAGDTGAKATAGTS